MTDENTTTNISDDELSDEEWERKHETEEEQKDQARVERKATTLEYRKAASSLVNWMNHLEDTYENTFDDDLKARVLVREISATAAAMATGKITVGQPRLAEMLNSLIESCPERVFIQDVVSALDDATAAGLTAAGQSLQPERERGFAARIERH